jgi:hypothetical protein
MNPDDIIKVAPEIAKGLTAIGAAIPFTGIVKRMLGPAADELAEMWKDNVRLYRYGNQMRCVEKAEKMAKDAGFAPSAVPPKILFPLLEGVSFEDNESLQDMWAALLANASSPNDRDGVRPGFIAVLRELAPDESAVLNWIFDYSHQDPEFRNSRAFLKGLAEAFTDLGFTAKAEELEEFQYSHQRLESCLDGLQACQLIRRHDDDYGHYYKLTFRGRDFVQSCRPPKPKA